MSDRPGNRQMILRVPPSLDEKIARDAAKQEVTPQAVVLNILGTHYGIDVPHPSRGRPKNQLD